MPRARLLALSLLAGCGGDSGGVVDQLKELEGVTVTEEATANSGYQYLVLRFEQPVDHGDPAGPKFHQRVALMHRDEDAPLVALTSGYWDYYGDRIYELTALLGANQISIEHRYFGESRPDPADWTKLTIQQMADDQHAILAKLHTVYPGAFVTTGGSKGGMTATYHRRFYPDDVAGTVPYVAPISFATGDTRYNAFVDTVGTPACRDALRAAAVEMLQNRRAALLALAMKQATADNHRYTRIPLGPALESAVVSLEWAFWQYYGLTFCETVPAPTAPDQELFEFLDLISPVTDNDDAQIGQFEAYFHQAYAELGYPDAGAAYLDPYIMYTDRDYDSALPAGVPAYDGGAAMHDIDDFVKQRGDRLLFVYGEWDPWTGGHYDLGQATDSLLLTQAMGTHGSRIARLATADREAAFAKLQAWTGVTPTLPPSQRLIDPPQRSALLRAPPQAGLAIAPVREPRLPSAMRHPRPR